MSDRAAVRLREAALLACAVLVAGCGHSARRPASGPVTATTSALDRPTTVAPATATTGGQPTAALAPPALPEGWRDTTQLIDATLPLRLPGGIVVEGASIVRDIGAGADPAADPTPTDGIAGGLETIVESRITSGTGSAVAVRGRHELFMFSTAADAQAGAAAAAAWTGGRGGRRRRVVRCGRRAQLVSCIAIEVPAGAAPSGLAAANDVVEAATEPLVQALEHPAEPAAPDAAETAAAAALLSLPDVRSGRRVAHPDIARTTLEYGSGYGWPSSIFAYASTRGGASVPLVLGFGHTSDPDVLGTLRSRVASVTAVPPALAHIGDERTIALIGEYRQLAIRYGDRIVIVAVAKRAGFASDDELVRIAIAVDAAVRAAT